MSEKLDRFISFCFYTLLFLVPLVLYIGTSELFEFNKMITVYVLTVLITGAWLAKMVVERRRIFRRTILDIPLVLFLISQILSTIVSFDTRTSLLGYYSRFHGGLLSTVSYSLLYWAWVSNMNKKRTKKAIVILIISSILVSIYGVLEHFGIDKNIWIQDVQTRVFSTLGQPNWLAAFLVALIPITWRQVLVATKRNKIFVWTAISALFTLTLLYTKSRSGILGFLVAFALFFGIYFLIKSKDNLAKRAKNSLWILIPILLLIVVVGTEWTPSVTELVNKSPKPTTTKNQGPALEVGGTESGKIREIVWRGAIDIWKHYPILGTGVETFAYSYYNFRPVEHNLVSEWDFLYNKAHNEYLNIAANTGTVGILTYLSVVFVTLFILARAPLSEISFTKKLFKKEYKKDLSLWSLAFLSGYSSILVTNFFGFSVVPVGVLFSLLPALAISMNQEKDTSAKDFKLENGEKIALFVIAFGVLFLLYSISKYWYADTLYAKGKAYNDANEPAQARNYLIQAVKYSPKEAIFWSELGQSDADIAASLGDTTSATSSAKQFANQAIDETQKAVSLSPKNVNLRRTQASIYIKLAAIDLNYLVNAQKTLEDAIKLAPTDAKLYYNLGLTDARIGKINEAIDVLKKTVNMKANYREARLALAILLNEQGQKTEAKEQLNYILTNINPNDSLVKQTLEEIGK